MEAAVDFGVVGGGLRDAEQGVDFGQQYFQCAAFAQDFKHPARLFFHQSFGQFLPDALGHQGVGLARFHHLAHQAHGFFRHFEAVACGEAGGAQDADGVFGKGGGDVAQDFAAQVGLAAEGVDDEAV